MMKYFLAVIMFACVSFAALPRPSPVFAQGAAPKASTTAPAPTALINPIGATNINQAIGKIIQAALGLSGAVALLMFVWGGVQMLVSAGNADMVKKGKSTLTWAALGIVVIFTAYTLVNVVIQTLAGVGS